MLLSKLSLRFAKEGSAVWVHGEVREFEDAAKWVLLEVPHAKQVQDWLKV